MAESRVLFLILLVIQISVGAAICQATPQDPVGVQTSANRPNILFAISDDQSWEHASAYGCKAIKTPSFDRIAKMGVLFNHSICASPGCTPSRSAILTGRYPWQLEQAGTHASSFPLAYLCYTDLLEDAGYFVGYTGKGWGPGNFSVSGRKRNPAGKAFNRIKTEQVPAKGIAKNDYAANFEVFLNERPVGSPFCFWYGGHEPHRGFEKGSGILAGKRLEDVNVPSFLPDDAQVRSDLLDYGLEIEWFDQHLGRMLDTLEKRDLLDSTLIVVTSDNGMAFPRAKANVYEYGIHMPLAICWKGNFPGGRAVDDLVSHTDLAPTFLQAAGVLHPADDDLIKQAVPGMTGRSLLPMLRSKESGKTSFSGPFVFSSRERHSSSRWNNLTYPQRCIRTDEFLLIRNFHPLRYPAGAPQKLDAKGKLGPMHGGYHDIDASPTLKYLIDHRDERPVGKLFRLAVDRRPEYELFQIQSDPGCLNNLATEEAYNEEFDRLKTILTDYLTRTGDPRLNGNGDVWEQYKRYSRIRQFPKPEHEN